MSAKLAKWVAKKWGPTCDRDISDSAIYMTMVYREYTVWYCWWTENKGRKHFNFCTVLCHLDGRAYGVMAKMDWHTILCLVVEITEILKCLVKKYEYNYCIVIIVYCFDWFDLMHDMLWSTIMCQHHSWINLHKWCLTQCSFVYIILMRKSIMRMFHKNCKHDAYISFVILRHEIWLRNNITFC